MARLLTVMMLWACIVVAAMSVEKGRWRDELYEILGNYTGTGTCIKDSLIKESAERHGHRATNETARSALYFGSCETKGAWAPGALMRFLANAKYRVP